MSSEFDIDGDGKTSPWEANICKMCLLAAIVIAFGDKALMFIQRIQFRQSMRCLVCGETFYDPDNIPCCRICYKELHLQKYVGPRLRDYQEEEE